MKEMHSLIALFCYFSLVISTNVIIDESIRLPLSTEGPRIIDKDGREIFFSCVTWFGAHMEDHIPNGLDVQSANSIAARIASMKFNCVRLTYSSELYFENPVVTNTSILAANTPNSNISFAAFGSEIT